MIEIQAPDGSIVRFPDGTPDDVIINVMRENFGGPEQQASEQPTAEPATSRTFGQALYENIIGSGEADTPGEKLGQYIRGAGAAVARGIADVPALPVNLLQLGTAGAEKLLGMEQPSAVSRALESLPETREMLASVPVIGPESRYVAPGTAGEYISTIGEFAGGAGASAGPKAMIRYGVVPGAASEAAGQAAQKVAPELEPYARAAAGIGASLLAAPRPTSVGGIAKRADAERAETAQSLMKEGIKPTAGQVLDAEGLMRAEGSLAARPYQLDQLTKAALRTAGNETARRATPKVLRQTQHAITSKMNKILDLDVPVSMDGGRRALQIADDYFGKAPSKPLPVNLRTISDELAQIASNPISQEIPAKTMRIWRTKLGVYTTSSDELTREAAHVLREVIDDMTEAALQQAGRTDDIAELAKLRTQYRNFLTIADASTKGGRQGASGVLSPERLSTSAKKVMGRTNYAIGKTTDLGELSRQAEMIIGAAPAVKPGGIRDVATSAGLGVGGALSGMGIGGPVGALAGGAIGAAAPSVGSAVMRSGPVQSLMMQPSQFGRSIATVPGLLSK